MPPRSSGTKRPILAGGVMEDPASSGRPGVLTSRTSFLKQLINSGMQFVPAAIPTKLENGEVALFTIAGGLVAIYDIHAYISTAIQGAATTLQLKFDSTLTGTDVDLDDGSLSINAAAKGGIVRCTGDFSDPLILAAANGGIESPGFDMHRSPILLYTGIIHITHSAERGGVMEWGLLYRSLGGHITES